jgi:hypothetical protein
MERERGIVYQAPKRDLPKTDEEKLAELRIEIRRLIGRKHERES